MMMKETILRKVQEAVKTRKIKMVEIETPLLKPHHFTWFDRFWWNVRELKRDDVASKLFDLSLMPWGIDKIKTNKSAVRIFITESKDGNTNIDSDVVEAISSLFMTDFQYEFYRDFMVICEDDLIRGKHAETIMDYYDVQYDHDCDDGVNRIYLRREDNPRFDLARDYYGYAEEFPIDVYEEEYE